MEDLELTLGREIRDVSVGKSPIGYDDQSVLGSQ